MDAQSGSRALAAASDLADLLRLAHEAAERVAQEVFGASFEHAELIARELQRLRRSTDTLRRGVEEHVARAESETVQRGHPMRRSSDGLRGRSP
jgi:hypothetical protein